MYSRFNLEISDFFYNNEINKHLESGKKIYEHHGALAKKSLKEFLYENGHVDGSSMKENWFQMEDVDIFISHSHQDIDSMIETLEPEVVLVYSKLPDEIKNKYSEVQFVEYQDWTSIVREN